MFSEVPDMPSQYAHLRTRLLIEQSRCVILGEKIGIVEDVLANPSQVLGLNRNLVLDLLFQIQEAFRNCLVLTSRFDVVATSPGAPTHSQSASASNDGRSSRRVPLLHKVRTMWEKSNQTIDRIEWAMIRKDSFEKLVIQLIEYNSAMESLLDRHTLHELHATQEQSNLRMLQVTEQIGQLRILVEALQFQRPLSRASTLMAPEPDKTSILASLATFKAQHLEVEIKPRSPDATRLALSGMTWTRTDSANNRATALYHGEMVWVEWRQSLEDASAFAEIEVVFEARVGKLAEILGSPNKPQAFKAPHCIGHLRDDDDEDDSPRYGLVYTFPTARGKLISLRELIQSKTAFSLTTRIGLAHQLAESLMYLHAVNWLHKGIRSDSILFIRGEDGKVDLLEPTLSGFDISRPDLPDELTVQHSLPLEQELYRHPDQLRQPPARSRKTHDIYSLGLVLAEIALWLPVERIADIEVRRSKLALVRSRLLDPNRDTYRQIACHIGDNFADVVRVCMKGIESTVDVKELEEEEDVTAHEMQNDFYTDVVARLAEIKT